MKKKMMISLYKFGLFVLALSFYTAIYAQRNFYDDQTFYVHENALINDIVGEFLGYPYDTLTNLSFSIVSGNVNNAFQIDNDGNIFINSADVIKYSNQSTISLQIQMNSDQGTDINYANIKILDPAKTVYIDASYSGTEKGTYSQPYNNTSDISVSSNWNYLLKRGGSYSPFSLSSGSNVIISAYGQGTQPRLKAQQTVTNTTNVTLDNLYIKTTGSKCIDISNNTDFTVNKCVLEGLPGFNYGTGIKNNGPNTNTEVLYTEIFNHEEDGIYLYGMSYFLVKNCYIHDVNLASLSYQMGRGDGIQMRGGCNDFHVDGCYIDRSNGYGKFCIITENGHDGVLIENNVFKGIKEGFGGAGLFLSHEGVQKHNIVRNNILIGTNHANTALYVYGNVEYYNNIIIGWSKALTGNVARFEHNTLYDNNTCFDSPNNLKNNLIYLNSGQKVFSSKPSYSTKNFVNIAESSISNSTNFIVGDPAFINTKTLDFRIENSSSARAKAENSEIDRDKFGVQRSEDGSFDFGAIEYSGNNTTTTNTKPTASFYFSKNDVSEGEKIDIDASGSSDANGDQLTYQWQFPSGLNVNTDNPTKPYFFAPKVDVTTELEISLIVNDGKINSNKFTRKIVILLSDIVIPNPPIDTESDLSKLTIIKSAAIDHDGNTPEQTIDESLDTRWSSEGTNKWIEYELSALDTVHYINASWYKGDVREAYFEIQVSDNQNNWVTVLDNQTANGNTNDFQKTKLKSAVCAKFLRIVGNGNSENAWNSINEVEIYGKPGININTQPTASFQLSKNEAFAGEIIKIDATGSFDSNGDQITYSWVFSDKIDANIDDPSTPFFYAPDVTNNTEFEISLIVNDGEINSAVYTKKVTIIPEPNESPVISNQTFEINTLEVNNIIGTIIASDPDANQKLNFSITQGNEDNIFSIDQSSGIITANKSVPQSSSSKFTLTILVSDDASNPLSANATVTINLKAVEINQSPTVQDQKFTIRKNHKESNPIGEVNANDLDQGQKLTYSIVQGNEANLFNIDSSTGKIFLTPGTFFTESQNIVLTIKVTDDATSPLSATANISIEVIISGKVSKAEVNDSDTKSISIQFDENLLTNVSNSQIINDFTISGNKTIEDVVISGSVIYIEVDSEYNYDDEILVSYLKSATPIIDELGNEIDSFTNFVVENNISMNIETGIGDDVDVNSFEVSFFPNPSNGIFTIKADNLESDLCELSIYSLAGNMVAIQQLAGNFGSMEERLNMSHLNSGTYIVRFVCDTQVHQNKIIIL